MFHRVQSKPTTETSNENTATSATETQSSSSSTQSQSAQSAASASSAPAQQSAASSAPASRESSSAATSTPAAPSQAPAASSRPAMPSNPYAKQPAPQSAARPGGYPGSSYSGVAYSAPKAAAPAAPRSSADTARPSAAVQAGGRMLTIGAGITMSGEIEACDNLVVEGTVEAALKGARNLDIAESGTFYGTVEIEEAVIAGRFEGDLTVNGRLTLRSGAMITGSVAYGELEIEAGAIIDGRLTPITNVPNQEMQQAEATRSSQFRAPVAPPRPQVSRNEDAGIFEDA